MADSASESDTGSLDGGGFQPPSPVSREQLHKRIESLQQQNRVLSVELETYKLRVKSLQVSMYLFSLHPFFLQLLVSYGSISSIIRKLANRIYSGSESTNYLPVSS
jgi:hypothetical protein